MDRQNEINEFQGRYKFLSNFWPVWLEFEGFFYPTVEHAYQASKTKEPYERKKIRFAKTAGKAKRYGKHVILRQDWEEVKLQIMESLVRQKFTKYKDLCEQLLATGDAKLAEGNWWHDTFWGVCNGVGRNHLGKILMKVRNELNNSL